MPGRNKSSTAKASKSSKQRDPLKSRTRFAFDIIKDVNLLQTALQLNPWQLGEQQWALISKALKTKFNYGVSVRSAKNRILNLLKMYKSQQFTYRTGTEEQKTQRGSLLESIESLIEESKAEINTQFGGESEDSSKSSTDFFLEAEVMEAAGVSQGEALNTPSNAPQSPSQNPVSTAILNDTTTLNAIHIDITGPTVIPKETAARRKERKLADEERDAALLMAHSLPEASGHRRKRTKLTTEDELIKSKQEHDIKVEEAKLELDKEKHRDSVLLENKKLELEELRETRLAENLMAMLSKLSK